MACPKRHLGAVAEVPRVSGGVYCHGNRDGLVTVHCAHFAAAADDPVHSIARIPDSKTQTSCCRVDIPTERNPVILWTECTPYSATGGALRECWSGAVLVSGHNGLAKSFLFVGV